MSVLARRIRLCRWFAAAGVVQQAGEAEEHFARALELEARSEGRLLTSRLALASLGRRRRNWSQWQSIERILQLPWSTCALPASDVCWEPCGRV